jgi:hypothetical protein
MLAIFAAPGARLPILCPCILLALLAGALLAGPSPILQEHKLCRGEANWYGERRPRRLPLRLRGGDPRKSSWRLAQERDQDILEAVVARERGPNSITSEVVFDSVGPGRRCIDAGMLEALRDFADMPMCNQSLVAFDKRVSLRALLVVVNGTADATPIEPLGTQAIAARCLHKLCATTRTSEELTSLCRARGVTLDSLLSVVGRQLSAQDPQMKWHLLDTIGLVARDAIGTDLLVAHALVPRILRCLWDDDSDVMLRAGKVAGTLASWTSGLCALFSGDGLQTVMEALDDSLLHVRLRAIEVLVQVSAARGEARECFETLGIVERIETSLRSSSEMEVLNALELAHALPIERLSTQAIAHLLADVGQCWSARPSVGTAADSGGDTGGINDGSGAGIASTSSAVSAVGMTKAGQEFSFQAQVRTSIRNPNL